MLAAMQQDQFLAQVADCCEGGTTQEAKTSIQNSSTRDLKIGVGLVVELSADVPTFRELKGSACAPGGRVDSKIEISSPAPSRL
jgi:hypothetical protein